MKLQQLSLFLENRPARCAFGDDREGEGINILTLSLADTAQFGILRLIVREWDKAKQVLERRLGGQPDRGGRGRRARPARRAGRGAGYLEGAGLNIEYMYAFSLRRGDKAILIFRFEDPDPPSCWRAACGGWG
jgi:hypothetical protein